MKICSKCGIEKTESEFHKDKSTVDGLCLWCRLCRAQSKKIYYKKNKDLLAIQQKERYLKNYNEIRACQNDYKIKNKEFILLQNKEYREKNKDAVHNANSDYRERNREYILEQKKEWYKENKQVISEKKHLYKVCNTDCIKNKKHEYYLKIKGTQVYKEKQREAQRRYRIKQRLNSGEIL